MRLDQIDKTMAKWRKLREEMNKLEVVLQNAGLELGKSHSARGVKLSYSKGRGRYDWEAIGKAAQIPKSMINTHTRPVTNWKAVCEASTIRQHIIDAHYTAGSPSVSVKLEKTDA